MGDPGTGGVITFRGIFRKWDVRGWGYGRDLESKPTERKKNKKKKKGF